MFEKKLTLHFDFHLRSKRKEGEAPLYCRLSYNGMRTAEYRLEVYVPVDAWDQSRKGLRADHPLAESLQQRLQQIKSEHESILLYQKTQQDAFEPTAETVKVQYKRKAPIGPSTLQLLEVYDEYVKHLQGLPDDEKKADKTLIRYACIRKHMTAFLHKNAQSKILAEAVTPGWGKQFYDYLRQCKIAKDSCTRYVLAVRSALNHALLYDRIRTNGLYEFKAPQAQPRKPIHFLRPDQLHALSQLPLIGIRKRVRDWALFMCYTGLDYNDARQVAANPEAFTLRSPNGDKWVYQRLKLRHSPIWGECHIPILSEAKALLPQLAGKKQPRLKVVNTHLKDMAKQIGLTFDFSSKVCRKTAGVVFMEAGYSMQSIQKILGHQSLQMTEAHYVSIQPSVVDKDTRRIQLGQYDQRFLSQKGGVGQ